MENFIFHVAIAAVIVHGCCLDAVMLTIRNVGSNDNPLDTGRKLNVHKTFRRRPGRLLNVSSIYILGPEGKLMRSFVRFFKKS